MASRTATRAAARTFRAPVRGNARRVRFQSTQQNTTAGVDPVAAKGFSGGLAGGLTGGALVFAAGYGYYHFSGAKSIVNAASSTKDQFAKVQKTLQDKAPEPNEALRWLRSTATSYAAFIPGAKTYVDSAFNDLDQVQQKHGDEVNKIVADAYKDLKAASQKGMTMDTATRTWEILQKAMSDIGELAADSAEEIINNHPQLKEKVGGNWDQLKQLADEKGPEAKKEFDQTYQQVKDVIKGGVSMETVNKIKQLVQEKTEKLQQLGDEAWKKGLEQAKPYFDKNPQVKEMIESNADTLKQGNAAEVFQKVKDAVSSGSTDDLQAYIKQAGEKAKNSGFGQQIDQYAKMLPGGTEIWPKLQKLQQVAQTRGDDAEKIMKGAYQDVVDVLQKRTAEAEKLAEKAGKEAKN